MNNKDMMERLHRLMKENPEMPVEFYCNNNTECYGVGFNLAVKDVEIKDWFCRGNRMYIKPHIYYYNDKEYYQGLEAIGGYFLVNPTDRSGNTCENFKIIQKWLEKIPWRRAIVVTLEER